MMPCLSTMFFCFWVGGRKKKQKPQQQRVSGRVDVIEAGIHTPAALPLNSRRLGQLPAQPHGLGLGEHLRWHRALAGPVLAAFARRLNVGTLHPFGRGGNLRADPIARCRRFERNVIRQTILQRHNQRPRPPVVSARSSVTPEHDPCFKQQLGPLTGSGHLHADFFRASHPVIAVIRMCAMHKPTRYFATLAFPRLHPTQAKGLPGLRRPAAGRLAARACCCRRVRSGGWSKLALRRRRSRTRGILIACLSRPRL